MTVGALIFCSDWYGNYGMMLTSAAVSILSLNTFQLMDKGKVHALWEAGQLHFLLKKPASDGELCLTSLAGAAFWLYIAAFLQQMDLNWP